MGQQVGGRPARTDEFMGNPYNGVGADRKLREPRGGRFGIGELGSPDRS